MSSLPASSSPSPPAPLWLTATLYHFVSLNDCSALRTSLQELCHTHAVLGLLLLAPEGINGTIAGSAEAVHAVLAWLRGDQRFANLEHKESWSAQKPFYRMRVRVKREIVTMGVEGLDPAHHAGTYVPADAWNALIDDPHTVVIDVRNDYEVDIGSFSRAINPGTRSFTEFPAWVQAQQAPGGILADKPKVAMFCTGGIRCEKSTALLKSQGFEEVYHLQGGVLKYLETIPQKDSRWHGDCFVFDERVSVQHGLTRGSHQLCRACRMPLRPEDLSSVHYLAGVRCHRCYGTRTPEQEAAFAEREKQIQIAWARGLTHIGAQLHGSNPKPDTASDTSDSDNPPNHPPPN